MMVHMCYKDNSLFVEAMKLKELVSHTIQFKEMGCMLHSILNYYLYNTYGPSFLGYLFQSQRIVT